MKKKFFRLGLCLLILMCLSVVSANENITDIESDVNFLKETTPPIDNISSENIISNENNDLLAVSVNDSDKLEATKSISTTITMSSVTANEGNSFTFTAYVKASNGMAVPGNVTFKYGNEFSKVLDKGSAKITYKGTMPPGTYTWTATYTGGSTTSGGTTYKFLSSTTTCKLTIMGNAVVSAENFNSFYQTSEKYQIKVTNSHTNIGIPNKKIKVLFYTGPNQYTTSYYYTDNNGIYEGTIDNAPGSYKIEATLVDTYYTSNTATFNISIDKKPIKLTSNQITSTVSSYTTLKVSARDSLGNIVNEGTVIFTINGKSYKVNVKDGVATKQVKLAKGTYECNATYSSENCYPNATSFNIVINKANVKLTPYKWISTTKEYTTLKILVKDTSGNKINEGLIKFTIKGKTYKINVKNGIATKKLKLKKAKTYKYKATFSSTNYNSKTVSSKVIVKPTKKYYTFKYGKLVGKISYKQYTSILNAYNNGKYKEISVNTGKYNTYKVPSYKTVKKNVWVYKKVLQYKDVWSSDWRDYTTYEYNIDKYWKNGWTWYGSTTTKENGGHVYKYYSKFKKKVTKNVKVKNGYKYAQYQIRMVISSTEGFNGFSIDFYDSYGGFLDGGLKNTI